MSLKKISVIAAPVRDHVVSQVRTAIEESHFEPGYRLVERELCELLGVGRSSVREALRQLEAEGLVQSVPQIGTIVALLDQEAQLRMIFEARSALEGAAFRLFTRRASDDAVARLGQVCDELEAAAKADDLRGVFRIKSRFYEILEEGLENSIISGQLKVLRTRLTMIRGKSVVHWKKSQTRDSVSEVRAVLKAVRQRDAAAAEQAALIHVDSALERALSVLKEELAKRSS